MRGYFKFITNLKLGNEKGVMDNNDSSGGDDDRNLFNSVERFEDVFNERNLRGTAQTQHVEVTFLKLFVVIDCLAFILGSHYSTC